MSFQDRTTWMYPSLPVSFLPPHIQISCISLLMLGIPLSGGRKRRERAKGPPAGQHIPWNEGAKQNHIDTVTKSTTVGKSSPCTYYDSCYRSILHLILDMSRWGMKEGKKGQEEVSWFTQWKRKEPSNEFIGRNLGDPSSIALGTT